MKVFSAALFTESNGLVSAPTVMANFEAGILWRPDQASVPTGLGSALVEPVLVWERMAAQRGDSHARGLVAFAMPSGPTLRGTYEALRNEILDGLRAAMPVDMVLLCLHGAMAAQGYDDVEGDVLEQVRRIVGPAVPVGAELDLHCNVTPKMVEHATVLLAYKEWPHRDIADRAEQLYELIARAARRDVTPVTAVYDCNTLGAFPTERSPMRQFVDRMKSLEGTDGVLAVSLATGYPWGDVPDMTTKVLVVADGSMALASSCAAELGRAFWSIRVSAAETPSLDLERAVQFAGQSKDTPVVFADPADNLLCGAPGDSTFALQHVLDHGVRNVAFGPIFDPQMVDRCLSVGEGARLRLRIGGKEDAFSGSPVNVDAQVMRIVQNPTQRFTAFGAALAPTGTMVWVKVADDVDIILTSSKVPTLSVDVFDVVGIDVKQKQMLFCKMWQHGQQAFAAVAKEVHIVNVPGAGTLDYASIPYRTFKKRCWPLDSDSQEH